VVAAQPCENALKKRFLGLVVIDARRLEHQRGAVDKCVDQCANCIIIVVRDAGVLALDQRALDVVHL